jgi:hypothetical protein
MRPLLQALVDQRSQLLKELGSWYLAQEHQGRLLHAENIQLPCPALRLNDWHGAAKPGTRSDEEASKTAAIWGPNPVHHATSAANRMKADCLENYLQNMDVR